MGFMPLAYVLSSGGTDYGNLSSILVSLLRYKNIPSSHLVAIRPDGSSHVWADFYMEGYRWIPLDVSAEKLWGTDFFGIQPINNNGIIMTKEVNMPLNNGESIQYITGLQTFCFWYWGYGTGSLSYLYDVIKK
jgi:hypothetical protein